MNGYFPFDQVPSVTLLDWKQLSDRQRIEKIESVLQQAPIFSKISVTRALSEGQIFVEFSEPIPASFRGTLLLDFEELVKERVCMGLTVWCEPIGDKNSLRNLRGITIKT